MIILESRDIAAIITKVGLNELMDETIEAISRFCLSDEGKSEIHPREGFHYTKPQLGLLEWMPVLNNNSRATIKVVGYHPGNPASFGMPTIIGSIGVYDTSNGSMLALADGTLPTAIRTGAASAAASRVLANSKSSVIGILGCGAQAVTQCHALIRCFPIEEIIVYDIEPSHQQSFTHRMSSVSSPRLKVRAASIKEILESSDIICTCSSIEVGAGPLFEDKYSLKPALHINAIGSDFPGKVELPNSLLKRARVIPDHLEQCLKEGEAQQLQVKDLGPTLMHLLANKEEYQFISTGLTVFDSTGWAAEDQIIMEILLDHAKDLNVGSHLDLHTFPSDPLNPYQDLVPDTFEHFQQAT